jgi:hypothetical protein
LRAPPVSAGRKINSAKAREPVPGWQGGFFHL